MCVRGGGGCHELHEYLYRCTNVFCNLGEGMYVLCTQSFILVIVYSFFYCMRIFIFLSFGYLCIADGDPSISGSDHINWFNAASFVCQSLVYFMSWYFLC